MDASHWLLLFWAPLACGASGTLLLSVAFLRWDLGQLRLLHGIDLHAIPAEQTGQSATLSAALVVMAQASYGTESRKLAPNVPPR